MVGSRLSRYSDGTLAAALTAYTAATPGWINDILKGQLTSVSGQLASSNAEAETTDLNVALLPLNSGSGNPDGTYNVSGNFTFSYTGSGCQVLTSIGSPGEPGGDGLSVNILGYTHPFTPRGDPIDPTPHIDSVILIPDLVSGGSATATITGTGFGLAAGQLTFSSTDISPSMIQWGSSQIVATFNASASAAAGFYTVQVKSAGTGVTAFQDGTQSGLGEQSSPFSNPGQFQVQTPKPPTITSINPSTVTLGTTNATITINGSGLGISGNLLRANLPQGVTSTGGATSGGDTTATITGVNVGYGATVGLNNLSVTVNNLTSNAATLTVNGPDHMVVQADNLQTLQTGQVKRLVNYQVFNFDGTSPGQIRIAENVSYSWSCTPPPNYGWNHCDGTAFTDPTGLFQDIWDYTPTGCVLTITDLWQWCDPAKNPSNPVTFGKLVGFINTNASQINSVTNPPNQFITGTVIKSDSTTTTPSGTVIFPQN